jgi:hypothetical protein
MKKKTCKIVGIIAAIAVMFLVSAPAWGDQIIAKAADASVAFRVYNGYTGTLTWVVGTDASIQTNTVTCDGLANTVLCEGANTNGTITMLATNAAATVTNASGTASLVFDTDCALGADLTTGTLLAGTYTAAAGAWLEVLWDTSTHLGFDLYLPDRDAQKGVSAYVLEKVNCVPAGTGNVTASIYKSGTLISQKIVTSPVYVNPSAWLMAYAAGTTDVTGVTTNSFTADNNVTVDWTVNLPFSGAEPVLVRVSRATTATTGTIGATIK